MQHSLPLQTSYTGLHSFIQVIESCKSRQTDVMWGEHAHRADERWWGVCIWMCRAEEVGATARSRISVFEWVWMNWDCLCSRGAAGSGEERRSVRRRRVSVTDRAKTAERHGVRLRERSSSEVTCTYIFHSCASEKHLASSLFLLSRVWCWTFITVCFCSSGVAFQHFESGMHITYTQIRRVYALHVYVRCGINAVRGVRVFLMNRFAAESVRESTHRESTRAWRCFGREILVFMRTNKRIGSKPWKVSYFNNSLAEMWHMKCAGDVFMRWFYDRFVLSMNRSWF